MFRFAVALRKAALVSSLCVVVAVVSSLAFCLVPSQGWLLSPEGEVRPYRGEWHVPVIASIILSIQAGIVWRRIPEYLWGKARVGASYLAGLFFWMALDDFLAVHEKIENFTRIDWLFWYFPIMGAAAVAGVFVILGTVNVPGARRFRLWALIGAAAWVVAQVLEAVAQFWDDARYYVWQLVIPEELLEMFGSAAFVAGGYSLLVVLRAQKRARGSASLDRSGGTFRGSRIGAPIRQGLLAGERDKDNGMDRELGLAERLAGPVTGDRAGTSGGSDQVRATVTAGPDE